MRHTQEQAKPQIGDHPLWARERQLVFALVDIVACLAQVVRIGLSLAQSGLGVEVGKTVNRREGAC